METRRCARCGETKPLSEFWKDYRYCKSCGKEYNNAWRKTHRDYRNEYNRNWWHANGLSLPMSENPACPTYLGIHIAERLLSQFFDRIDRMPMNNPGFDFVCGKGFKIDVKSACLYHPKSNRKPSWHYNIAHNTIADYFLCIAFDDREKLNPVHVWLIPGPFVGHLGSLLIKDTPHGLAKFSQYEKPLDKVITCCNQLRGAA